MSVAIDLEAPNEAPNQAPTLHCILPHGRLDSLAAPRDLAGRTHVD
jgi:hypothetical protein